MGNSEDERDKQGMKRRWALMCSREGNDAMIQKMKVENSSR